MKHLVLPAIAAAAFAFVLPPAIAQDHEHSSHGAPAAPAAKPTSQPLSEGTVRRLDRAAGSVTLTHGPIENLGMSAMTMTFTFKKGVVPASVKEGDKIRFRAEEKKGQLVVVRVEAVK
ncbi:MAG: copper-binding protein [Sulfuritalea sp.]|jgi:Cu/Ag efflux protein CusF|nr:copper-binding protein [Sulfuritalea sp.]